MPQVQRSGCRPDGPGSIEPPASHLPALCALRVTRRTAASNSRMPQVPEVWLPPLTKTDPRHITTARQRAPVGAERHHRRQTIEISRALAERATIDFNPDVPPHR